MLKIKQALQSRLILLLLSGIILGSISFSISAFQEANQHEQEAKRNIMLTH